MSKIDVLITFEIQIEHVSIVNTQGFKKLNDISSVYELYGKISKKEENYLVLQIQSCDCCG